MKAKIHYTKFERCEIIHFRTKQLSLYGAKPLIDVSGLHPNTPASGIARLEFDKGLLSHIHLETKHASSQKSAAV